MTPPSSQLAPAFELERVLCQAHRRPTFTRPERGQSELLRGWTPWSAARPLGLEDVPALALVRSAAPLPAAAFVNENFAFYRQCLTGAKELGRAGSAACVRRRRDLGEALGQRYVEKTFGAEGKARMHEMVDELERRAASRTSTSWPG